eukprot:scaffold3668_cov97-Cylindrotheca_fusiformis.AAC.4
MEADCVGDAVGLGSGIEEAVAAVVFHGGPDVPGGLAVHCPAGAVGGLDVFDGLGPGRGQWSAIKIEGTVELSVGRELGVDARLTEEI